MPRADTRHRSRRNWFFSANKPFWRQNQIRHGGSNRKTFLFPVSILNFFVFQVQLGAWNQKAENPHKIRDNEETSFVVQTHGVQIAKDVSDGGRGWIRTTEVTDNRFTVCPLWPLGNSPLFNSSPESGGGAGGRIRTPDLLITNQLLCQLSYTSASSRRRRIL